MGGRGGGDGAAAGVEGSDAGVAASGGGSLGTADGAADEGGAAGGMDAAVSADGARASGYVVCGSVTECPLANGGQCCYTQMDESSACQGAGASCESVPATGPNPAQYKASIVCDSSNDCPSTEICCYSNVYIGSSTACMPASSCVDMPGSGPAGYTTYRRQVCDPTKVAPTECLSGTCQTATNYSTSLPPYLYLCL
jgi:hypothetical protein